MVLRSEEARQNDPEDGTCSEPSPRRTAFADETFLRSRLSRSPSQCVDDNGEKIHLFDPDAHNHFTNNKQDEGTRGYMVHMMGVSNGWCNSINRCAASAPSSERTATATAAGTTTSKSPTTRYCPTSQAPGPS